MNEPNALPILKVGAIPRILALVPILLIVECADAHAQAPRHDVQEWNELQVIAPLHPRLDLVLDAQLRFGDQISRVVTGRGSVGLTFKLSRHFSLTPGYVYQDAEPILHRKSNEHRITLAGAVTVSKGKFTFTDNNLIERRLLNSRPDSTRYRNRLRVGHPAVVGGLSFDVFLSDEVYYDWSVNAWVRNRFSTGAGRRLTDRLYAEVFFLRQNDGHVRPGDISAIGAVLRIRL